MSLKIDKVQLEIIMKADNTRAEMRKLDDEAKSIQKSMKGLKKDSQEWIDKNNELTKVKAKWNDLNNSINLTNKTMKELQDRAKILSMQMRNMDPNTAQYKEYRAELDLVNSRMKELRGTAASTQSGFSQLATGFNKYFAIGTAFIASITGISFAFRKLAEDVAHMDDVYSDVMKTTGLTHNQVLALNEQLKKMDTRTSRESLNNLARDAGKLGIDGTKNIMDFVDAGNQINVALGEDLGEDAIKNIGKMVGVFQNSTKQLQGIGLKEQMLAVGSAVNQLGASSTASEPYLVAFAGRLGGISKQAKISMADILGYASSLDQDMQQVEMSATALQNFIMKLMGEPAKFAKLAGLEVTQFSNLLNTDANAAIKQVLRSLNEKGGFQQLIPIFQEMGLDGARATGVLSSLAGSIDKVDQAQIIANHSMSEGTSITNEYNIKNNNLAAKLDKAKKAFQETSLQLGESLNPILLKSTNAVTYLVRALVELPKWIKENKGLLIALAIAATAYGISIVALTVQQKLRIALTKAEIVMDYAAAAAKALLTGNVTRFRAAMKLLNAELLVNPYIAIGVAIAALTYGIYKLVTAQTVLQKSVKEYNLQVEMETNNSNTLFDALKRTGEGTAERKGLIDKINSVYGEYLTNQLTEKSTLQDIAMAQMDVNRGLREKIGLQMQTKAKEDIITKFTMLQNKSMENLREKITDVKSADLADVIIARVKEIVAQNEGDINAAKQLAKNYVASQGDFGSSIVYVEAYVSALSVMKSKLNEVDKQFGGLKAKVPLTILLPNDIHNQQQTNTTPVGESEEEKKAREAKAKERATAAKKLAEDQLKARQKLLEDTKLKFDIETDSHTDRLKAAGLFEMEYSVMTEDQLTKRTELEELYYKNIAKIATEAENSRFENEKKELGLTGDPNKLKGQKLKAYELLFKQHQLNLQQITQDGETKRETYTESVSKSQVEALKAIQTAGLKAIESGETNKTLMLKESLARNLITQEEYDIEIKQMAWEVANAKLQLAEASLKALEKVQFKDADAQKIALDASKAEIEKLKTELRAAGIEIEATENKIEKKGKSIDEKLKDIFGNSFSSIGNLFSSFNKLTDKSLTKNLKSFSDWAGAIGEFVQAGLQVAIEANDQYFAMKGASLEADKQRDLTTNEDRFRNNLISEEQYNKQKETLNKDYAQKELDLKKQQSSSDTTLKVAQAIAAGGLAIVQAFAQLGPVGGAIAAILVGGITSLQVGTILKQNAAIQATTLESTVSGSDSPSTPSVGARVVSQAADGRYDVVGKQDGKLYKNVRYAGRASSGLVTEPTLMGEAGTELVVSAPHLNKLNLRAPNFMPWFMHNIVNQRASGKYDVATSSSAEQSPDNSALIASNVMVMNSLIVILTEIQDNGIKALVVLSELEAKQALQAKSINKGSLTN